eukprot:c34367_g1_i1 orf=39-404(+)
MITNLLAHSNLSFISLINSRYFLACLCEIKCKGNHGKAIPHVWWAAGTFLVNVGECAPIFNSTLLTLKVDQIIHVWCREWPTLYPKLHSIKVNIQVENMIGMLVVTYLVLEAALRRSKHPG